MNRAQVHYSLLGQKRQSTNHISKRKDKLGINMYNKVSKILKNKNFELSEKMNSLEEGKYFHICHRNSDKNEFIYYLEYLKNKKKKVVIINKNKSQNIKSKNKKNLEKKISKPGTIFECFSFI